jgi:hypothetical protein
MSVTPLVEVVIDGNGEGEDDKPDGESAPE